MLQNCNDGLPTEPPDVLNGGPGRPSWIVRANTTPNSRKKDNNTRSRYEVASRAVASLGGCSAEWYIILRPARFSFSVLPPTSTTSAFAAGKRSDLSRFFSRHGSPSLLDTSPTADLPFPFRCPLLSNALTPRLRLPTLYYQPPDLTSSPASNLPQRISRRT